MKLKNYKLSNIGTCVTVIIGKAIGIGLSCSQNLHVKERIGIIVGAAVSSGVAVMLVTVILGFYNKHKVNQFYSTLTKAKQARLEEEPLDVIDTFQKKDKLSDKDDEERQKTNDITESSLDKKLHVEPSSEDQELSRQTGNQQASDITGHSSGKKLCTEPNINEHNDVLNTSTSGLTEPISENQKLFDQKANQQQDSSVISTIGGTTGTTYEEKNIRNSFVDAATMVIRKQKKILHVHADGTHEVSYSGVQTQDSEKTSVNSEQSVNKLAQSTFRSKLKTMENKGRFF